MITPPLDNALQGVMTKISRIVSTAFGIAALALAAAALHSSAAHAQSADLVLCDRLAADPADPDKPADVKGTPVIAASDIATAIKFCKIASAGSRRALYQLGRAYAANSQMPEAIATYRKAADKGNTSAMVELGVLYGTGAGVAKDPAQARTLFERAAAAGNTRAIANLATLSGGGGAPSDPAKARDMFAKAAEANSAEAQYQLGLMYADGTGGPKDDVAARGLFEKAAAQGHAGAMVWAGAFAELGRGGTEDKAVAKSYYTKAAALGNEEAKGRLKQLECPYVLKDKKGDVMTNLCF
jgi:TPR repeat protein